MESLATRTSPNNFSNFIKLNLRQVIASAGLLFPLQLKAPSERIPVTDCFAKVLFCLKKFKCSGNFPVRWFEPINQIYLPQIKLDFFN